MEILIVTGMSGAGKSKVVDALEDLGYFCADNLPPQLIITFAKLLQNAADSYPKVAFVTDIRSGRHLNETLDYLTALKNEGFTYKIFFIDADDPILVRRYKETRRVHPLLNENGGSLSKSIAMERNRLSSIRAVADYYIDTSSLSAVECKRRVTEMMTDKPDAAMKIHCMSFGFKYGIPTDCDLVFDVRCLPNPFYEPELKEKTGLDKPVKDYVLKFDEATTLLKKLYDLVDYLLPLYVKEGKGQLVIGFGCTGGRHRSVCFAQEMSEHLGNGSFSVSVSHRDINK